MPANDDPNAMPANDDAVLTGRVRDAVGAVLDPELRRPLADLGMIADVQAQDAAVHITVRLTIVGCPAADRIRADVRDAALRAGAADADVSLEVMSTEEREALTQRLRGGRRAVQFGPGSLTRIITVTSGKGGVGKSSLTANLAVALTQQGLTVGVLDADVHGFSIPGLLGLVDSDGRAVRPTRIDDLIVPPIAHGVKAVSIGMFLRDGEENTAVAWRGPMLHRTVRQFLTDVHFGDLDVLLLDMPPGTGDVAISVGQLLPAAEVLVVTTPQPAAAGIAVRSGLVARQLGQRLVGVVENMAPLVLPDGTRLDLFGSGGGGEAARALSTADESVPLLASVPLSPALRGSGDAGVPLMVSDPDDPAARAIAGLAAAVAATGRSLSGRALPMRPL